MSQKLDDKVVEAKFETLLVKLNAIEDIYVLGDAGNNILLKKGTVRVSIFRDRVTKNPEEVTCIACQRIMKETLLDHTEELLEALKRNQEVMKAIQEQHGNGVLILPAVWPHETTPHVEIYNNQKLIDGAEGK